MTPSPPQAERERIEAPVTEMLPTEEDGHGATSHATPPNPPGDRFRPIRPHARGGLGEVFLALDVELNRHVALKRIRDRLRDSAETRSRFLLEAEITGSLQHPGIVPVYGLGRDVQDRPYYAMRFIEGDDLRKAIRRFHEADDVPGRDPGERSLSLRTLLRGFIDACNAIAYAHSRGVLHRDLKPSNIMLGPYGETLVVDWGLARRHDRALAKPGQEPGELQIGSPEGVWRSGETRPGTAIGTPAFMSPEQAAGSDDLGPASDIYSLGATLYMLLTGRPAFEGLSEDVRDKVRAGDFAPPRSVNHRVAPGLEAICLKAMALEPEARYPDVGSLAADVERWLGDEPVSAYRDGWPARLARWGRRHRPLVASASALLLTALVALSVGSILLRQANTQTAEALTVAEENFGMAREAVDRFYTRVSEDRILNEPGMDELRKDLLNMAREFYAKFVRERAHDPRVRADLGRAHEALAWLTAASGSLNEAVDHARHAVNEFEGLTRTNPSSADARLHLAMSCAMLGNLTCESGRPAEAEVPQRRAVQIMEELIRTNPANETYLRELATALTLLGHFHGELGQWTREGDNYRRALVFQQQLVRQKPDDAEVQSNLALLFGLVSDNDSRLGRHREAKLGLGRSLEIHEAVTRQDPNNKRYRRRLARDLAKIGLMEQAGGNRAAAEEPLKRALEIRARLAADHPSNTEFQREWADALGQRGALLKDDGRLDEAATSYRQGLDILEALVRDQPDVPGYRLEWASLALNLGRVYERMGKLSESETITRKALDERLRVWGEHPSEPGSAALLGETYRALGDLAKARGGREKEALQWYDRAARLQRATGPGGEQ